MKALRATEGSHVEFIFPGLIS